MEVQNAPIDPIEWDLVCVQLDELASVHDGQPWPAWKDAVVEWHVRALASARSEAWIPGLAGPQEPVVEEALGRFYRHHVFMAVSRLRNENVELRRKLIEAVQCARFYASGATDGGGRASSVLKELLTRPAAIAHVAKKTASPWRSGQPSGRPLPTDSDRKKRLPCKG
jgi:hypothetical protein